ncbi:MAG: cytochrome C biogenesis protein, partial [Halieaceae bacterium]|nr:cytochrome C biogenesis protein [Halieaceae bacterium]
ELAGEDGALVEEARLRLLEDGVVPAGDKRDADRGGAGGSGSGAPASAFASRRSLLLLVGLLVAATALIYRETGSLEDVLIYRELRDLSPDDGEAARVALLERIRARSAERPDNLQYLNLLGRLNMAAEDFAAAGDAFARLVEQAPEDPQALAMAAQARFLASGRQLDPQAQLYAERALAVDPEQRAALGLLGMASFEAGSYNAAVTYWERLRELEDRGSPGYEMLGEVLALARERAGLAPAADGTADDAAVAEGPGISVALRLAGSATADPSATVFVFARPRGQGGMPVAVRRLRAGELPLTLRLTDSDAMAGQLLSEAGSVVVSAQVSANGQPGQANALFSGQSSPIEAGDGSAAVTIELEPVASSG